MGSIVNRVGWAVVIVVLLGAALVFYLGITGSIAPNQVAVSDQRIVDPAGDAPAIAVGTVTVGPAGLAIPVAGVKPRELVDTYSQARAGGARVHDSIDIMAPTGTPVVAAARTAGPSHAEDPVPTPGESTSWHTLELPASGLLRQAFHRGTQRFA